MKIVCVSRFFCLFSFVITQQHISHTKISPPNTITFEQELCVNICSGSSAGVVAAAALAQRHSGTVVAASAAVHWRISALAHQRSGLRHSGAAAVTAAAMASSSCSGQRAGVQQQQRRLRYHTVEVIR